ncbi:MAG: TMEM165/GDT1 family protein [Parvibaculaceae bacterium]|nr:TMEM165/GDT1 family protein [Parvibaculaceae bacterium]
MGETNGIGSPLGLGGETDVRWKKPPDPETTMEAFTTSTAIVTLAEMGDKTQLLAILLATRFHRPVLIMLGILLATIANHFLATLVGTQAAALLNADWFRYLIALSFLAMAVWALIPDRLDDAAQTLAPYGVLLTTIIAFFWVEMGDKTQIATIALGARFQDLWFVTAGTTIGMMLANAPAIFLGHRLLAFLPLRTIRAIAAGLFLAMGIGVLWSPM